MIPFVDMHCHLLGGVDDGPRSEDEALEMCRIAVDEGVRLAAATAHQNEHWSAVTPTVIREATARLMVRLRDEGLPLSVFPCAEVMVHPEMEDSWRQGKLLAVADRAQYMLVEMPHNLFIDLRRIFQNFRTKGVRCILAHPERQQELLHESGLIEQFIASGCLIQVCADAVTAPANREDGKAIKDWFQRGIVHMMGSDAHSPRSRRPQMADAYQTVSRWVGSSNADRVFSTNGTAILHGLPLHIPQPQPRKSGWLSWLGW